MIHQAIRFLEEGGYHVRNKVCMVIGNGEMGKMAAKILIDRIEGGHEKHLKILFPYDIIERKSTAAFRKIHGNPQK